MKKLLLLLVICFPLASYAQRMNEKTISVIESAMRDELARSTSELKRTGLTTPFFIAYTVADNFRADVGASFGALTKSTTARNRQLNLRLMVGDYQLNDENFSDGGGGIFGGGGAPLDMNLSLDDDYDGIRRGFWLATDNLFKEANETFTKKKAALERKQLSDEDKNLPDFAKAPVVTVVEAPIELQYDKQFSESLVRELSAVFSRYAEVQNCNVTMSYTNTYQFYRSTEGTTYRKPSVSCDLNIQASAQSSDDGEPMGLSLIYSAQSPSQLPIAKIKADVEKLANTLRDLIKAPKYSDKEYTGPVLFDDDAAKDFINDHVVAKFAAAREDVLGGNVVISFGSKGGSFQKKIGTRVLPTSVTLRDNPLVKTRDNISLLGSYSIDDEGVKPFDMTLVENGILKTMYMSRTPTKEVKEPNGHARSGGGSTAPAPGIVEYLDKKAVASKNMRKDFFKRAKENGYNHAFIIRSTKRATLLFSDGMGNIDDLLSGEKAIIPSLIYKVDLKTGNEQLMRGLEVTFPTSRDIRELISSKETSITNMGLSGGGQGGFFSFGSKVPGTLIGPNTIMVPELEVRKKKTSAYPTKPVVERPS